MTPLTHQDYSILADLVHEWREKELQGEEAEMASTLLRKLQGIERTMEQHPGPTQDVAEITSQLAVHAPGPGLTPYLFRSPEAMLAARTLVACISQLVEEDQEERDQAAILHLLISRGPQRRAELLLRGGEGLGDALAKLVKRGTVGEEERDGVKVYSYPASTSG